MRRFGEIVLSFFCLFGFLTINGQNSILKDKESLSIFQTEPNLGTMHVVQVKIGAGQHLYTGESLSDILDDGYSSLDIRIGWQSKGYADWQKAWNYPLYGVGFYTGWIGERKYLGKPGAIYGFFRQPFLNRPKHHFSWDLAVGLTYDLNPYDPEENPLNDAIGGRMAVYFTAGIDGNIHLKPDFDLTYGFQVAHFSNGRIETPNYGLNMVGVNLGVQYYFNSARKLLQKINPDYPVRSRPIWMDAELKPWQSYYEWSVGIAAGIVQAGMHEEYYGTFSLTTDLYRRYDYVGGIGVGLDLFYDGSMLKELSDAGESIRDDWYKLLVGAHVGHRFYIWRFSIDLNLGTYVFKKTDIHKNIFARLGLKYSLTDRWYSGVALKTQGLSAADWVEWGIGYRLWK